MEPLTSKIQAARFNMKSMTDIRRGIYQIQRPKKILDVNKSKKRFKFIADETDTDRMQATREDHLTKECWMTSESPIVQQRVCSLAGQHNGNFLGEFDKVKETYEFNLKRYNKRKYSGITSNATAKIA